MHSCRIRSGRTLTQHQRGAALENERGVILARETRMVGRLVKEKSIAEEHLIKQRIPWSIIRPGALIRIKKPTGEAFLTENPLTTGAINRTDLGGLIHKVAVAEQAVQKIYNALDRSDGKVVAGQGELAPVQL